MDALPHPSHLTPRFLSRSNSSQQLNGSKKSSEIANGRPPPEPQESTLSEYVEKFRNSVEEMSTLLRAMKKPLPEQTCDGTYLPADEDEGSLGQFEDLFVDVFHLNIRDLYHLLQVFGKAKLSEPIDDRKYLMEKLIQAAAKLPDRGIGKRITDTFLTVLYDDLEHPPKTLLGEGNQFRMPDGSGNNCYIPDIGRAGAPYARTVASKTKLPGALPDPGLLFDSLLARKEPTKHPNRISSMLFYLASIIIHDIFKTDHKDYRISNTSSYLDLAPLYGSTWVEQKTMRTFKDGTIKPDSFAETRLLSFPPGVGALLILFNRFHNYVVGQLAVINQDNRFSDRDATVERYGEKLNRRDDDLFQTARLVTCGLYVNIVLIDYVRTILNLNRSNSNWQLNPRVDIPNGPPQATGNQVSAEFNLVYRWHAAISDRDDKWTQDLFKQYWPGKDYSTIPELEIVKDLGHMEYELKKMDPMDRAFPPLEKETLHRQTEGPYKGSFRDDDIAAIITAGIEDCANAFGPQQIPLVMRSIEILGIQQARSWNMATLNEFRKHFALAPHKTFEDITQNHDVAEALKHLYDTPDSVELYPGLIVEDPKEPMLPGSGLCPGYTISRGVLSDAVALVRGDRFYTTSYTPSALTNFGFQEASSDVSIDNGCVLYKLLLRGLPYNYDPQSVYAHYPFTVPSEMQTVLEELNKAHKYDFTEPKPIGKPSVIFGYDAAKRIINDQEGFKVGWTKAMEFLMGPKVADFCLAGDEPSNAISRERMEKAIYLSDSTTQHSSRDVPTGQEEWLNEVRSFYTHKTLDLLQEKSHNLGSLNRVDLVRDVGNLVHVHFVSAMFALTLKTEQSPHGIFTEYEFYLIMAAIFATIFFDDDPVKSFPLRQQSYEATQKLGNIVQLQVASVMKTGDFVAELSEGVLPPSPYLKSYGIHMIRRLCKSETDVSGLVWGNILGTIGAMVANQGQLWSQALDYFMSSAEGQRHFCAVSELAKQDTPEADDKILHYFLEAARLSGESGIMRTVANDTSVPDKNGAYEKTWTLKAGDRVMINLKAASRDPAAFPNPDELDLTRPVESYILFGSGSHQCLGLPMTLTALSTVLKVVAAQCENLRPATVAVGKRNEPSSIKKTVHEFFPSSLQVIPESWHYHGFLSEDWDMELPFPSSLKVVWDGPALRSGGTQVSSGNEGP